MNGKRILSLFIAIAVAGAVAAWILKSQDVEPSTDGPNGGDPTDTDVGSNPFDIEPDVSLTPAGTRMPEGTTPIDTADAAEAIEQWKGTPVEAGTEVPITVNYRPGTTTSYRVATTTRVQRRGEEGTVAQRQIEGYTVTVLRKTKDGGTRVRVKRDWFKLQSIAGPQFTFEYDSRSPEGSMLSDPSLLQAIQPRTAMLEKPYELKLDKAGQIVSIKGIEEARKAFQEALVRLNVPRAKEQGPTAAEEIENLRGWLFPSTGGGTLKAGEPRKFVFRVNSGFQHWVTLTGELDATHNDPDSFCLTLGKCVAGSESFGKPGAQPNGVNLAKLRVPPEHDRLEGSWVFDRKAGRLLSTRMRPRFQLHVSFATTDAQGKPTYQPHFQVIEQLLTADVVEQDASTEPEKDTGDDPQKTGGAGNAGGEEAGTDTKDGLPTPPEERDAPK